MTTGELRCCHGLLASLNSRHSRTTAEIRGQAPHSTVFWSRCDGEMYWYSAYMLIEEHGVRLTYRDFFNAIHEVLQQSSAVASESFLD